MKWTIRTRLIGLSALGIALLLTVGITGAWTLHQAVNAVAVMNTHAQAGRNHLEMDMMHDALHSDALTMMAAKDGEELAAARKDLADHITWLKKFEDRSAALALEPAIQEALKALKPEFDRYCEINTALGEQLARGDRAAAQATFREVVEQFEKIEPIAEEASEMIEKASQNANAAMERTTRNGRIAMFAMSALAILMLLFVAQHVTRRITRPLDDTVRIMDAVAGGDLVVRAAVLGDDELGRMAGAVNRALDSLSGALSGIAQNAVGVGRSSEELTVVSQDLTHAMHETSSRSQQVSAASEEVDSSVRLVVNSAHEVGGSIREVAQLTNEAVSVAGTAVRVAGEANNTIRQLGESSEQIDNVVRTISSIAEQTNILALNAEIEAARAGEAGKGFSVVANEVKDLAKETARATDDIARRVSTIRSDSRAAVQAISEIVQIIDRISATQSNIATAMQQQSTSTAGITRSMTEASAGTTDIATNIAAVADMAERGSSTAHRTQRAAEELSEHSAELQRLLSAFRFAGAAATPAHWTGGREMGLRKAA